MAKANSKASAMFFKLALLLSLLFVFSSAFQPSAPSCKKVYGVKPEDTCFDVGHKFNLTEGKFTDLNPNLVCEKLFIGQWLCISGTV